MAPNHKKFEREAAAILPISGGAEGRDFGWWIERCRPLLRGGTFLSVFGLFISAIEASDLFVAGLCLISAWTLSLLSVIAVLEFSRNKKFAFISVISLLCLATFGFNRWRHEPTLSKYEIGAEILGRLPPPSSPVVAAQLAQLSKITDYIDKDDWELSEQFDE